MNENLNLANILKECPRGTKLYSTVHGEVEFYKIVGNTDYPISFEYKNKKGGTNMATVTMEGKYSNVGGECILFPSKDQRDWSKFKVEPEMIDGEFYYCNYKGRKYVFIYKEKDDLYKTNNYAIIKINELPFLLKQNAPIYCGNVVYFDELRKATEEEKQLLLNAIKRDGYNWDADKKELIKVEPKFDKIKDLHLEVLDKVYNAGYNDAMKKALEWLDMCLHYHDCGDYDIVSLSDETIEDAIERFKEDNSL